MSQYFRVHSTFDGSVLLMVQYFWMLLRNYVTLTQYLWASSTYKHLVIMAFKYLWTVSTLWCTVLLMVQYHQLIL